MTSITFADVSKAFDRVWIRGLSSIEAPSSYHLWCCCVVVPEAIVYACATGSSITRNDVTGSCITGNDLTVSRESEMKGR